MKQRADMEADYMTTEERDRQIREEGLAKGREEARSQLLTALISTKLHSGISPQAIAAELALCFEMAEDVILTRIAEIQAKSQN